METKFILYRIYYGNKLISYIGQTTQLLKDRMYQHFFKDCDLDFNSVTKIEYAFCNSKADLNIYEMYYINLEKPFENIMGISKDKVTIQLPTLEFIEYDKSELSKYKKNDKYYYNRKTSIPKNEKEFLEKYNPY